MPPCGLVSVPAGFVTNTVTFVGFSERAAVSYACRARRGAERLGAAGARRDETLAARSVRLPVPLVSTPEGNGARGKNAIVRRCGPCPQPFEDTATGSGGYHDGGEIPK